MLSFRRGGFTPVLKFVVDMFATESATMRKLRNNPDLVLSILQALQRIGADVTAVYHDEELLQKYLADPKNFKYAGYKQEGYNLFHFLAE